MNHSPDSLSGTEQHVAMILAWHADKAGGHAYPSLAEIASKARLSERQARRVLRQLEAAGVIAVEREATNRHPTMYCFPSYRGDTSDLPREDVGVPSDDSLGGHGRPLGGTFETPRGDMGDIPLKGIEPSVETSENRQENKAPSGGQYPQAFDEFWKRYPRTNGTKRTAFGVWSRLSVADRAAAADGLQKWIGSEHWRDGYVVYAERYLSRRMWEDDPAPARSPNGVVVDEAALAEIEAELRALETAP